MLMRNVLLISLGIILSACSAGGSMDSSRLASGSVILNLNSSSVSWDGTNLVGSISIKATDLSGAPISGYIPTASVTSSTSVSARILASISTLSPFNPVNRTVTYNVLPCSATDTNGLSTCQVQVSSGTGTLSLLVGGTGATAALDVNLNFYSAPAITSVSPAIFDPNTTGILTLTGTGFRSPMTVTVGTLTCASVNVTSTTTATCSLTTTATLGLMNVKATTPDGQFDTLASGVNVKDRAAPIILVSTQPTSLSNQATTTIGFSVTDNDATIANLTITCTLDSSPTTCAPPTLLLSSLADGLHNLTISAVDPSGNSSNQSVNWTIDTAPPTLTFDNSGLGSSPSSSTTTRSVTIGGADVVTYKAVVIRSGSCTSADFSAATETAVGTAFSMPITTDGNYTICGIGKDAAGNWQTVASSSASSTLAIDTSIPYIVNISGNLTSPSNEATARSLTMSGTDVAAYKAVTLKNVSDCSSANFTSVTETAAGTPYSMTFSGDGNYIVCAIGRNAANTWQPTPTATSLLTLDTTPPTLNAISLGASPSNSNGTRSIQLSGTGVVQYKAISYTSGSCDTSALNSATATSISTLFSLPITSDGSYNICAIGKDAAGNWQSSPTVSSTLVIDTIAPILAFTSPAAGASFASGVTLQGTCETGLTVTLAGTGITSSATTSCSAGTFSQAVTLSTGDGSKTITASQTDAAGNIGSVAISLIKDSTAPNVTFTSPAANTSFANTATVQGTCDNSVTLTIAGSGIATTYTPTCTSGGFSQVVSFTSGDGSKTITATQIDAAGNTGSASLTLIQDTTPPVLTITSPAVDTAAKMGVTITGACETGLTINLSGGLSSPSTATCTSGAYSQAITFTSGDGAKLITLTQTDAAGNVTSVTREFIKDTTAPVLTFNTGVQTQSSNTNTAIFSGTCEANLTISATLNSATDGTTTCGTDGTWSYTSVAQSSDGSYSYTFTETDAASNTSTITGTWTRDATPPTLTLTAPASALVLAGGGSLSIQWTTADTHLALIPIEIDYSANGGTSWSVLAPALTNSGSYSWTLPNINSTSVQVRVISSDTFGNTATATSPSFTIDSSPPVVTLTSLTGGQLFKGGSSQAITWTATDSNLATTPITLSYSADGGTTWTQIATGLANSGSYSWTVPSTSGTNYYVKVVAADTAGHTAQAMSTSGFAIDATPPTLTNVTLNGQTSGVVVASTSTVTIGWTASDLNFGSYPIAIYYSANGGSTWSLANATSLANSPSTYAWNLSGLSLADGSTYQVKVVATDSVGNQTSVATSNFSVLSSAPSLNFASGTVTNAYTNGNTVTYTGTCTNGYSVTITGTDGTNTSVSCSSGSWTWTTATNSSQGAITYTFSQTNGAFTTNISATWTRDTIAPTIGSVTIDGGASTTSAANLSVAVAVGTETNMSGLKVQLALANITSQVCPSVGTNWQSFPSSGSGTFNYSVVAPPGTKTVCVWLQDAAGNTSSVASSSISFQNGTPPTITSFAVTNGVASTNYGTSVYAAGDTVNISWTVTDAEGLAANPIYLDYTTDGSTWTPIVSGYGGLTGTQTSYSATFSGFSAPSTFFEIRIRATDNSSNWAVPLVSTPQNAGQWTVFAGSTDRGVGSGASTALVGGTLYGGGLAVINPNNNDIYMTDRSHGILKIPSSTGIVSTWISHSSSVNLSTSGGTITSASTVDTANGGMVWDGGYIYLLTGNGTTASSKIWRINPTDNTYTLYFGGGTDTSTSATSTTAFVMFDAFRFDEDHSLYFFSSCASPVSSYTTASTVKLMKVTQTTTGAPGTISAVAGNCVNGTPVSGTAAIATPMGDGANVGTSSLAVWNHGNMIYFRLHGLSTVYKIVNGTLYSTALATNGQSDLVYSSATTKLYQATGITYAWTPTTTAGGETSTTYVNNGASGTTCNADGIVAATAACSTTYRIIADANGQVYVLDGAGGSNHPYRLRYVDGNGKIWTLAGSLPFYGNGLNPLYTRGTYKGIYYKPSTASNLTAFPSGLYFTDPQAPVLGFIQNNTTSILWGNQGGTCAPSSYSAGVTISSGLTAGCAYGSPSDLGNLSIGFDSSGLPWYRPTWAGLIYIDANLHPTYLNTGTSTTADTTNWMLASTSASPSTLSYFLSVPNNMTIKSTSTRKGIFSLGAYNSTSPWTYPGPVLRFFDFTNNAVIHIMGSSATAGATADSSTAGADTLTNYTISSSCQFQNGTGCYTQFIEGDSSTDADDVLYFTEGASLRSIANPFNPGSQTLKTIFTESSTLGNFILTPDNHRIYYLMGGYLYCYALSKDYESADCMNRKADVTTLAALNIQTHGPLGPPAGMATFPTTVQADSMTWKDSKTLLISNGQQVYQYNVPQPTATTQAMVWGVNLHANAAYGSGDATAIANQLQIVQSRGLKAVRIGSFTASLAKAQMDAVQAAGLRANFVIGLEWIVNINDGKTFTTTDPTTLYNNAYNYTYNLLLTYKDYSNVDWELSNEIDLKAGSSGPAAWNSGWTVASWTNISGPGSSDYFTSWSYILKGASDAIAAINTQYGKHHRRVLNWVGTDKGFVDFMISKGVNFDMLSYHSYYSRGVSMLSLPAAQPGLGVSYWNLFAALASYNVPIVITETNCGEIYNGSYQNVSTDPLWQTCLSNLRVQLGYYKNNSQMKLEAVYAYELYDEPANAAPENRFGLMFNSSNTTYTPKTHLYLFSSFAGGTLSTSETNEMNSFGLLPLP